jgi:predicted dehydrogenase
MNRRDFLKDASAASMMFALGARELRAEAADVKKDDKPAGPPVNVAVIGASLQGRNILTSLAKMGGASAPVVSVCDSFSTPSFQRKVAAIVPSAAFVADYRKVLDDKTVQAVFIATPSHKHKQIALDAIAAGKHVYCEMPLSNSIAEAKAIAVAGLASKMTFAAGLQQRSNMQTHHVLKFVRSDALGTIIGGRAQWHNRNSWRQGWPTPEREVELNWRLNQATSSGLLGEVGVHQIDMASWFFNALPTSVTAYSSLLGWKDGRNVPDTVQVIFDYPNNLRFAYEATLVNSFDGPYELFMGTDSAIQLRDQRAWMFKETDAKSIGWEVFARKDAMQIGNPANGTGIQTGSGIALVADATKQIANGLQPGAVGTDVSKTSLYQAIDSFLNCVRTGKKPDAGALEGYQATVVAIKANEAALKNTHLVFDPEWFKPTGS